MKRQNIGMQDAVMDGVMLECFVYKPPTINTIVNHDA